MFLSHDLERVGLLSQGGFFVPNRSTAVQHFLMCHGLVLDEVILQHLLDTFLGNISENGADAALWCSANPQNGFQ